MDACFSCNANMVLGGAILILLHAYQGSVRGSSCDPGLTYQVLQSLATAIGPMVEL